MLVLAYTAIIQCRGRIQVVQGNTSVCIIYAAINSIDNKIYIGQTSKSLEHRKQGHMYNPCNPHFHHAVVKYGKDKFVWIILEEVCRDDLDSAEDFWIQYFKFIGAELYNINPGGITARMSSIVKDQISKTMREKAALRGIVYPAIMSPDGTIYNNIRSLNAFAREHGLNNSHIYQVVRGRRSHVAGFKLAAGDADEEEIHSF